MKGKNMSDKNCTPCKANSVGGQAVIEGVMMKPMYDLPGRDDVEKAIVTAAFVRGDEELKLITK